MSQSTTAVNPTIWYDSNYIITLPGVLKAFQVIFNLLGFVCVVSTSFEVHGRWFSPMALSGFLLSGTFLTFYLFHVTDKFYKIPWLMIDIVFCGIWMIFNLIASIFMAQIAIHSTALCAATVFGFTTMVFYGADGIYKFTALKT